MQDDYGEEGGDENGRSDDDDIAQEDFSHESEESLGQSENESEDKDRKEVESSSTLIKIPVGKQSVPQSKVTLNIATR